MSRPTSTDAPSHRRLDAHHVITDFPSLAASPRAESPRPTSTRRLQPPRINTDYPTPAEPRRVKSTPTSRFYPAPAEPHHANSNPTIQVISVLTCAARHRHTDPHHADPTLATSPRRRHTSSRLHSSSPLSPPPTPLADPTPVVSTHRRRTSPHPRSPCQISPRLITTD